MGNPAESVLAARHRFWACLKFSQKTASVMNVRAVPCLCIKSYACIPGTCECPLSFSLNPFQNKVQTCPNSNQNKGLLRGPASPHIFLQYVFYTTFIIMKGILKQPWSSLVGQKPCSSGTPKMNFSPTNPTGSPAPLQQGRIDLPVGAPRKADWNMSLLDTTYQWSFLVPLLGGRFPY